eukprot:6187378-Pleurochrysis_carterae.AAC.2
MAKHGRKKNSSQLRFAKKVNANERQHGRRSQRVRSKRFANECVSCARLDLDAAVGLALEQAGVLDQLMQLHPVDRVHESEPLLALCQFLGGRSGAEGRAALAQERARVGEQRLRAPHAAPPAGAETVWCAPRRLLSRQRHQCAHVRMHARRAAENIEQTCLTEVAVKAWERGLSSRLRRSVLGPGEAGRMEMGGRAGGQGEAESSRRRARRGGSGGSGSGEDHGGGNGEGWRQW